jgi:hypothetical protein
MAHPILPANTLVGTLTGTYKQSVTFNQAGNNTALTKAPFWTAPYACTLSGVWLSILSAVSTDRTITLTIFKRAKGAAAASDVAMLATAGVITQATAIQLSIGTSGVTAPAGCTNPVLHGTAANLTLAAGDTVVVTTVLANSNGTIGTDMQLTMEFERALGDGTARASSGT